MRRSVVARFVAKATAKKEACSISSFELGVGSSHPYAVEDLVTALEDTWSNDEMRFAVGREICLYVSTSSVQKNEIDETKKQVLVKANELGLDLSFKESTQFEKEDSLLRLEQIRTMALRWLARECGGARIKFEGESLVALNLNSEFLEANDRDREMIKSKSPLLECVSIRISAVSEEHFEASIQVSVLRCGRLPLRLIEKLASKNNLRKLDAEDEDFAQTICFAIPKMSEAMRIIDLSSGPSDTLLEASQRRGFDRWRPLSFQAEAALWSRLADIQLPLLPDTKHQLSHAVLIDALNQPYFLPVPRVLLVGQVVQVPAATKQFSHRIETKVLQLFSKAPWLTDFQIVTQPRDPLKDQHHNELEQTRILVSTYQESLKRELSRKFDEASSHNKPTKKRQHQSEVVQKKSCQQLPQVEQPLIQEGKDTTSLEAAAVIPTIDVPERKDEVASSGLHLDEQKASAISSDIEELKRAKLARKLARQQERERRKLLKASKDSTKE